MFKRIAWNKGKKTPNIIRDKMRLSHLGKSSGMKGRKQSEISRRKMSIAKLGSKLSIETKRKISDALKGEKSKKWKGGYENILWHNRLRRIRSKNVGGYHTLGEWENLKAQYNFTCPCCHVQEPKIKLTLDHIIPISKGGSHNIENIQPLCLSCNSKKNNKIIKFIS